MFHQISNFFDKHRIILVITCLILIVILFFSINIYIFKNNKER